MRSDVSFAGRGTEVCLIFCWKFAGDWDSEDSGTEESGPEDEEEEAKEKVTEKGGEAKADRLEHAEAGKASGAGAEAEVPRMQ